MSGKLSTHVLDTSSGRPAAGIAVELRYLGNELSEDGAPHGELVVAISTDADGRTGAPLLSGAAMRTGTYRMLFGVGDYFRKLGHPDAGRFLEQVVIEFRIDDPKGAYHVPLLVTPWSYTTYRGS